MDGHAPRILLCDCAGSFAPDGAAIEAATGLAPAPVASRLCTAEAGRLADALRAAEAEGSEVVVACAQMAETFAEIAAELDLPAPLSVDIRDRAGWTDAASAARTGPKQAALLAAARLPAHETPVMDVESAGLCLVLASTETGAGAAARLAETLSVTVLSTDGEAPVEAPASWDLARGRVRSAAGALGGFALSVDGYAPLEPAGRGTQGFGRAADGAQTGCDIVVDLRGGPALFPAPEKRDGYLRADPADPIAVTRAIAAARELVGTFEKTLHVRTEPALCAHKRAGKTGCTRCLSVCPTGAITVAAGDAVEAVTLDPAICAGCGACAAVCPSGAILADDPAVEPLFRQLRVMADAWALAGATEPPRLLVHDDSHGAEMIRLAARHGDGLPADVIPLETRALTAFGHAEMLVALALGYGEVTVLLGPKADRAVIEAEQALAEAVLAATGDAAPRLRLVDP
ncbi:MAG: 4Fe-4S dicluster domain-containing protein, partial [Pseudomonadota bacterium]